MNVDDLVQQTMLEHTTWPTTNAEVLQALGNLSANGYFQTFLRDMIVTILMRPCACQEEEGERRLVLRILQSIKAGKEFMDREADRQ